MKTRFRLIRRGVRGCRYYCVDTLTAKRTSLKTRSEDDALQIVQAKNQALPQPSLNLHIAKAYLAGSDSGITTRTWQDALQAIIDTKQGETKERWQRAANEKPLDLIRRKVVVETPGELFLEVLKTGTVSTNVHLRKLHNFCLGMNWLPWPIIPKKQWPPVRFKPKRAITFAEHNAILTWEQNPERNAFYELCWHLGGSQSDVANLQAEDIDWQNRVIAFYRKKTGSVSLVRFGNDVEAILRSLPDSGPLFPHFRLLQPKHRAKEFKRACNRGAVSGVTLHSYRYAWAERAKACGYPERFAQEALGHNSKAVHRAYARKAQVKIPALEDFERQHNTGNVTSVSFVKRTPNLPSASESRESDSRLRSPCVMNSST